MKILILTNMYPTPKYPFYGIFVKEQVESLRKEGIFVDVFFINGRDNRLNYFFAVPCLVKKLRFGHYDIVHTHHTYCIYPFWIAKSILGLKIPLILTFHEAEALKSPELVPKDIDAVSRLVYSKRIKKWAVQRADFLISVCKDLIEVLNFKRKSTVKPPGVDLELFKPLNKFECRRKLNLAKDKKIIFFPADIKNPKRRTQKGFDILQTAFAILRRDNILLVTGGSISHQDMPLYVNASDVIVQTSNFEASPMVIKEAMACNVPIVSTDVGDTKEIIGNTEGCFVCEREPEDIAQKIGLALDYGKRTVGRKRVEELGLEIQQIAKNIIKIYKECLVHWKMTRQDNDGGVRRSRKVCIVRRAYYPEETHTRRNAETLLQNGYSIDIICERATNQLPYEVVRGVQVFRLPIRHKRRGVLRYVLEYIVFSLWVSMKLTWLHSKKKYDVIEIESMPDFLVFAGLIPKLLGSKVILYLFEDMPELMASKFCLGSHNFSIKFLALVEKLSANYAHHVIVCHELSRQKLLYQRKVKTPITVILNVPDEGVFALSVRNTNRTHPNDGSFTIIHHGTITENYGIQAIIEAVSLLRKQIPIRLKIFGKGEYRRTLRGLAKTLGATKVVNFMGYVSQEKLLEEIAKADAGAVALLNEYQSPNKLFELVAMGKPVLASSLQTIRQHFNGDSLKYFRVGDAKSLARCILELYRNPSQRASLIANASKIYEKYQWSKMKKKYLKIYEDLTKRK